MSGDDASLEGQATETGAESAETPHDWEKDYKELQAEYSRKQNAWKQSESVWEDEDAALAMLAEKFPHLVEQDDMDESEAEADEDFVPGTTPPPPQDPRVDELLKKVEELNTAESERVYQADLQKLVGDRELGERGAKFVRALTFQGGDNYKALETAVNEWFAAFPEDEKSKRSAAVLAGGKATMDAAPDYDSMPLHERHAAMAARARAMQSNQ